MGGGADRRSERGARYLTLLGRLQPGASIDEARARFNVVAARLFAAYPEEWRDVAQRGRTITVLPERETRVPPEVRGIAIGFMAVLLAGVALVLLICCMNIANLLLARGSARMRDVAIRVSFGASRGRLVRQLDDRECAARGHGVRRRDRRDARRGGSHDAGPAAGRSAGRARGRRRLARAGFRAGRRGVRERAIRSRAGARHDAARHLGDAEGGRARSGREAAARPARCLDHGAGSRLARPARKQSACFCAACNTR